MSEEQSVNETEGSLYKAFRLLASVESDFLPGAVINLAKNVKALTAAIRLVAEAVASDQEPDVMQRARLARGGRGEADAAPGRFQLAAEAQFRHRCGHCPELAFDDQAEVMAHIEHEHRGLADRTTRALLNELRLRAENWSGYSGSAWLADKVDDAYAALGKYDILDGKREPG